MCWRNRTCRWCKHPGQKQTVIAVLIPADCPSVRLAVSSLPISLRLDNAYGSLAFAIARTVHCSWQRKLDRLGEAGNASLVTDEPVTLNAYPQQEGVAVAIGTDRFHPGDIARGLALGPKPVTGAAEEGR